MSFQIYNWLEKYVHEVVSTFGYRIWFIGVQGIKINQNLLAAGIKITYNRSN